MNCRVYGGAKFTEPSKLEGFSGFMNCQLPTSGNWELSEQGVS